MKVFKTLFLIVLMSFLLIQIEAFAHEGHLESDPIKSEKLVEKINIDEILSWLGNFHLILLHFPIALVCMVVIAELLFFWQKNPLYDNAGRFMLLAAAVMAIPTVLTGFAYGYNAQYEGVMASYFWWHRFFGILSVVLVITTTMFREFSETKVAYYLCLFLLFICVNVTAFLGGSLTFGIGHLWPSFLK